MSDGILLVDKPAGGTSADAVRQMKRAHRFRSIGHVGTLDPMATGLLPLCIGRGTRVAQFLSDGNKEYTGRIRFGEATDSLDVTGEVTETAPPPPTETLTADRLAGLAAEFLGERRQRPPMFSAVKRDGQRLYELARAGVVVEREERPIRIDALELTRVASESVPDSSELAFRVACSKGTYVRVLADEIARRLGSVGALAGLRRTRVGDLAVEDAIPLADALARPTANLPVLSPRIALAGLPSISVSERVAWALAAGQPRGLAQLPPPDTDTAHGPVALIAPGDRLLGIVEAAADGWQLRRILLPEAVHLYRSETPCYPGTEEKTEEERWR